MKKLISALSAAVLAANALGTIANSFLYITSRLRGITAITV